MRFRISIISPPSTQKGKIKKTPANPNAPLGPANPSSDLVFLRRVCATWLNAVGDHWRRTWMPPRQSPHSCCNPGPASCPGTMTIDETFVPRQPDEKKCCRLISCGGRKRSADLRAGARVKSRSRLPDFRECCPHCCRQPPVKLSAVAPAESGSRGTAAARRGLLFVFFFSLSRTITCRSLTLQSLAGNQSDSAVPS